MRIVHLTPNVNYGGLQESVKRLSLWLKAAGHDVTLLYWLGPNSNEGSVRELEAAGIEVLPCRNATASRTQSLRQLMTILKRTRCEIFHVHNTFPYYFWGTLAARLVRVPVVLVSVRATAMFKRQTRSERAMVWIAALLSTRVVSVSAGAQAEVRKRFPLPEARHVVIENGTHLPPYLAVPPRSSRPEVVFGTVGRLVAVKNQAVLIDAFARLHGRHAQVRLHLLGSGPLEEALRERVRRLGLDAVVTFAGFSPDVASFLAGLDVFVLPSQSEGLPLSLVEAFASGLPAVATNVGGTTAVMEATDGGWLCRPDDVNDLHRALEAALEAPDRVGRGEQARARVANRFSVSRMGSDYEGLYRRLLTGQAT